MPVGRFDVVSPRTRVACQAAAARRVGLATGRRPVLVALLDSFAALIGGSLLAACGESDNPAPAAAEGQVHEVDYGLVELDHGGAAVAVASYKYGGAMVLYPGEEFHYHAVGSPPLPPLELQLGAESLVLEGAEGKVTLDAPGQQPVQPVLHALGERVSMPGAAPPRVTVTVQVFGKNRPSR